MDCVTSVGLVCVVPAPYGHGFTDPAAQCQRFRGTWLHFLMSHQWIKQAHAHAYSNFKCIQVSTCISRIRMRMHIPVILIAWRIDCYWHHIPWIHAIFMLLCCSGFCISSCWFIQTQWSASKQCSQSQQPYIYILVYSLYTCNIHHVCIHSSQFFHHYRSYISYHLYQ